MTKYFEVLRRDGPARMGKLLSEPQIGTPGRIGKGDFLSAGSVYGYASMEEAAIAGKALLRGKKLAIMPYVPSPLRSEPALDLPAFETEGPKGVLVHPFSSKPPQEADVYVLGNAGALNNPRDMVAALVDVREMISPDSALYAPALATPANLALLVYLGVDLVDGRAWLPTHFGGSIIPAMAPGRTWIFEIFPAAARTARRWPQAEWKQTGKQELRPWPLTTC